MEKIIFDDNLMFKKISSGKNGTCYLTTDKVVFKNGLNLKIEILEKLSNIYTNFFIFPKKLVYSKDNILIGYIMDYVDGVTIKNLNRSFDMSKYLNDIKRLEYEISMITLYNVSIIDAGINNVIFDNNDNIKIIDTDFYNVSKKYCNTFIQNEHALSYTLLYPFIDIYDYKFSNDSLNKYLNYLKDNRIKISSFIEEVNDKLVKNDLYSDDAYIYKRNIRLL